MHTHELTLTCTCTHTRMHTHDLTLTCTHAPTLFSHTLIPKTLVIRPVQGQSLVLYAFLPFLHRVYAIFAALIGPIPLLIDTHMFTYTLLSVSNHAIYQSGPI